MWYHKKLNPVTKWTIAVQLLNVITVWSSAPQSRCKTTPSSADWPSTAAWAALSSSVSGHLIKTVPPGAVCHPDQPTYNPVTCPIVQAGFLTSVWHTKDPVSSIVNNWNDDTCLPLAKVPCSGEGYPIYVVNAISKEDVKAVLTLRGRGISDLL